MIRTTLTPATTRVFLTIPNDYIGKKVEVLLNILEEVEAVPSVATTKKSHRIMQGLYHRKQQIKLYHTKKKAETNGKEVFN